jgi:regulator of cell morphogenesis and NO signaling
MSGGIAMTNAVLDRENQIHATPYNQDHPMLRFTEALEQLKAEHDLLRVKLQEFAVIDEIIRAGKPNTDWFGTLRNLKERVEGFLIMLEIHSDLEDLTLFPTVKMYMVEDVSVLDVLEEDHQLATQYIHAFLEELRHSVSPIHQGCATRIIELLMNAHQLLLDHFNAEEELIYPIADQILDDIDYLSC